MFKIKYGYKIEFLTAETMKIFGSTKKLIHKTKNGENVPSLEVVEVVLVQCNLLDNQYQQKPELLFAFMRNKSFSYLLNTEPNNLVFLKTYNTDFGDITITFTNLNGRPFKIEDKVKLTMFIYK